jgi:hypothetical protein
MPELNVHELFNGPWRLHPDLEVAAIGVSRCPDVAPCRNSDLLGYMAQPNSGPRRARDAGRLPERTETHSNPCVPAPPRNNDLWSAFIGYATRDLEALALILATRDLPALKEWMHRTRGALLVLKCMSMAARCRDLEARCGCSPRWSDELAGEAHALASDIRKLLSTNGANHGHVTN